MAEAVADPQGERRRFLARGPVEADLGLELVLPGADLVRRCGGVVSALTCGGEAGP
jgi:hypothetical protein